MRGQLAREGECKGLEHRNDRDRTGDRFGAQDQDCGEGKARPAEAGGKAAEDNQIGLHEDSNDSY